MDGGGGLAGLLLLSLWRGAGAGAAAETVAAAAADLPARGAGGGGGGAAGRQGKVAVGGSGRSGGWLDGGRRGRDGDEYIIRGLEYGSAGAEVHAPPLCR